MFRFEDGDELDGIEDAYIFNKKDYELTIENAKNNEGQVKWIGVKNVLDEKSSDLWAKSVGWYSADIDGGEHYFSLLLGKCVYFALSLCT